jgi:hypothetical protein
MAKNELTPREPLTRYDEGSNDFIYTGMSPFPDGEWVKFTDVEARDQAREAEIRALILDAKLVRHNEPGAVIQHPGFMPECPFCIRDLDALLTPASQEGTTR